MTSRERVLTAMSHREPDRVPLWFGMSPEFLAKAQRELGVPDAEAVRLRLHDDFRRVYPRFAGPAHLDAALLAANGLNRSVFGVDRRGYGYGQPVSHPLAGASLEEIEAYPWPDARWWDVSGLRGDALSWGRQYAILGGDWSPVFHDVIDLMGMENMMVLMYEQPETVHAVIRHVADYYCASSRRQFEAAGDAIDVFFIGNDIGSQTGPLMGEALFREFFSPVFKRLADLGHAFGLKVMMHICGAYAQLMPALIDCGIDAVQALQPVTKDMQPASLKRRFGDALCFSGCIDSVETLIRGTPESVRAVTRETLKVMMPGGGYILSPSHDYLLEETPLENVLALADTGLTDGVYPALRRADTRKNRASAAAPGRKRRPFFYGKGCAAFLLTPSGTSACPAPPKCRRPSAYSPTARNTPRRARMCARLSSRAPGRPGRPAGTPSLRRPAG